MLAIVMGLVVLLLLSLGLNYNLYQRSFLPFQKSKLDPLDLLAYADTSAELLADKKRKRVMFYGDSRAFAWPNVEGVSHARFINRGIGGQTSAQVLKRFPFHVAPYRPDIIVLQVCVNDLKLIPLFPKQREHIIRHCQQNLQQLVAEVTALKSTLILTTVYPIGDIDIIRRAFGFREPPIIAAVDEVNAFIKTLATDKVIIFDSYSLLKGKGRKIAAEYSRDWLHLNPQGYRHLNKSLRKVLQGLLENNGTQ